MADGKSRSNTKNLGFSVLGQGSKGSSEFASRVERPSEDVKKALSGWVDGREAAFQDEYRGLSSQSRVWGP